MFSCDGRVVDEKERDGDEDRNDMGGYEGKWEIRGTTCLIGYRIPRIGVHTRRIGSRTCRIGDGKLTRTRNSLKSQFLMMISPISSHLSLSSITREREVKSSISISPCHDHELTPNNSIHPRSTVSRSQSVSHLSSLGAPCCSLLSTFPRLRVNQ